MGQLQIQHNLQQKLFISPRLMMSTAMLQMDAQELSTYINNLTEENPFLEQQDDHIWLETHRLLRMRVRDRAQEHTNLHDSSFDSQRQNEIPDNRRNGREELIRLLTHQLERLPIEDHLMKLCCLLIRLLDEDGYLEEDIDELIADGTPREWLNSAIEIIQGLEPAGIGARNICECLVLQLRRIDLQGLPVIEVVSGFLKELGRKQYRKIAAELGITEAAVHRCDEIIQKLNPKPAAEYASERQVEYIYPDLFVLKQGDSVEVVFDEYYGTPHVTISDLYLQLMDSVTDNDTKAYLHQKLRQANWVLEGLAKRRSTMELCVKEIVEQQRPFFMGKTQQLKPLTMKETAKQLHVHTSTISRCVRGKYLECCQGIFPLRYFFTHSVTGQDKNISEQAVKQMILQLVNEENKNKPLSDQKICAELNRQWGISIARRTVAKYRDSLRVPAAYIRKYKG